MVKFPDHWFRSKKRATPLRKKGFRGLFRFHWVRFVIVTVIISLIVVYWKREEIAEHPLTKKKMEFFEAIYHNELDTAKQLIEEVIDSSMYLK